MSRKLPAMQFYPGDWLKDTSVLSATARGVWISILVAMWDRSPRGVITASVPAYARLCGASEEEILASFSEMETHNIPDLKRESNGDVTLKSRRMIRDQKDREKTADRVAKHRHNTDARLDCNGDVTRLSLASSSSSSSSGTSYLSRAREILPMFSERPEMRALSVEKWLEVVRSYGEHPKIGDVDWPAFGTWAASEAIIASPSNVGPWMRKRLGEWLDGLKKNTGGGEVGSEFRVGGDVPGPG